MIVGVFAGWLLDAGHLRLIIVVGAFLEVFGLMMTSLSTKYWQILLSQAVCTGLGSGLLGLTSVAVIPLYFSSRRMIATGIAATGSSLGMSISQSPDRFLQELANTRLQLASSIL
jgi:MFS family permease